MGPAAVLKGGPARIDSDRYQISAKAGDTVSKEMMNGPMRRALLEERFRLKSMAQFSQALGLSGRMVIDRTSTLCSSFTTEDFPPPE